MGRDDRHAAAEVPVFDADEAPRARARGPRGAVVGGRRPGRARSVGIAVAALVVLTAGVAIGGILEGAAPSPSASAPATPEGSAVAATCTTATTTVPSFVLVPEGSTTPGRAMLLGLSHGRDVDSPSRGWLVPGGHGAEGALAVGSGTDLELLAQRTACLRYVLAEYASATLGRDPRPDDIRLLLDRGIEPGRQVELGTLPDGDWVVRAVAYFEIGIRGPEGLVYGERFFRVRVGAGPFPTAPPTERPDPTPRVTPAVPCAGAPTDGDAIRVVLRTSSLEPVEGLPEGSEPPEVSVALGEDVELSIVGDACAIAWRIQAVLVESEDGLSVEGLTNPAVDPAYASQNRWRVELPAGDLRLVAELTFEAGIRVTRTWNVVGRGFDVPDVFLVGTDGTRVVALPGCGLYFELANGYQAGDDCGVIEFPDGLEVLSVPAWSFVSIEVPGWTLMSWNGQCGTVGTDGSGSTTFDSGGCGLGGFSVEPGEAPPGPARFLARPGPQALQIYIHATLDGDTFSVPMYAYVTGR
ncbi:MAG TPA: hypothetical protein VFX65_07070 [Candidatus Limnocylindrales bacterium]|nr:hypothetical protein [Candidatus Limnocylindrales bacterium]